MPLSRRLIPYLLLATLTLGAGLGAGLSVAEESTTEMPSTLSITLDVPYIPGDTRRSRGRPMQHHTLDRG